MRLSDATSKGRFKTNKQTNKNCWKLDFIFYTIASKKYNIKRHRRRQIIEYYATKTGKCLHNHVTRPAAEVFEELCVILLLETSVVALYCNI